MFCSPCSDVESDKELSSSSSSDSEDYYYEPAEDFLNKKKSAKPRKAKTPDRKEEAKATGYGPNNIQESLEQIPSLMDPKNDCKCGRSCLSHFEFRPLQAYIHEKSKLDGRATCGAYCCSEVQAWGKAQLYDDPSNLNWSYFLGYADAEIKPLAEPQPQNAKLQMNPVRPADCCAAYHLCRQGVYEVQETQFRKYLRAYLRMHVITMRKRKDYCAGKCTTCEVLAKQRRAVKTREDLEDWKTLNDEHRNDYRVERATCNSTRADSANKFGLSDSFGFDGAANNNTVCPHFPVKEKAMSDKAGGFFHLHLQAVVLHGEVLCMCLLMPWIPGKDVNTCLSTTFNILLRHVVEKTPRFFRQTCHVKMDGGSENWNRHVFGFFSILVHHGLYKEMYLHRLPVGHSHDDLDGFFGLLKMLLWGKTADKEGHWFISLEQWIAFLFAWKIETMNKQTAVVGCNLNFKAWIDPHLNPEFGGHAGRNRLVHTWCMYVAPDMKVRAKYKFGDSYPGVDSAPDYMDNLEWKRKGQGNKVLDMEKTTRSCLMGLRAATPELVSQERHDELKATFPLPLKVEDVRKRNPERLPLTWDAPVAADSYEDKHLHRVLTERNADLRGLTTKIKKLERLIQLLKAEDAGAEAPAVRAEASVPEKTGKRPRKETPPAAGKRSQGVRRQSRARRTSPASEGDSDSDNGLDLDLVTRSRLMQAAARKKRRGGKQQKRQKQPSSSDDTDDSDDESSSGLDECLADRKMRVAPQKENLSDDYTFEDMPPGSFAVTVAGGEDTDKCWFDVMLQGHGKPVPLHFVEVAGWHDARKEKTWQFWLPAQQRRTFETVEQLCVAGAFVRGPRTLRMKCPFDVNEMFTCWDDTAPSIVQGGIPAGEEKDELLKALVENCEE
ncbi:hypothetical protein CYMTET_47002 [Cymbomonas tetramitiformis]|uniref:DUF7869 domain-containing protein n=1 Tax=Cymbomonas tetramitiformis TaxID=36881 RepID=A0AAE0BV53_9CHLO|nr:hypothetical protein CYMTET_47002 [Cymbomonas tetramitiformis]